MCDFFFDLNAEYFLQGATEKVALVYNNILLLYVHVNSISSFSSPQSICVPLKISE